MDPILLEIVLWIAGFAAIGSAVGVVIVLAGWWLVSRMAESVSAWLGHAPSVDADGHRVVDHGEGW